MISPRLSLLLAGAAAIVACSDSHFASPDLHQAAPPGAISVMTWNVYVGTDVDAIIRALADGDPSNDEAVLLEQVGTLLNTDFATRAAAFADEIAAKRPHAVGLQEVSNFDLSALGLPPLEFMPILEDALAARGLNYVVADSVLNIEASPMPGLGLQDFDFLLVDANRVTVLGTLAKTFEANLVDVIGPVGGIELRRGYVLATVVIDDEVYTIVSTHPEPNLDSYDLSDLRAGQALEIVTVLDQMDASTAIVMGDLNDQPGSSLYQLFAQAGFVDAWAAFRPGVIGYTCCHAPDLANRTVAFDERIDYVLVRGFGHDVAGLLGHIDRLGEVPGDRVRGPVYKLWPSDHAGLFAEFLRPPAKGLADE
jgi:hypothetical protein